MSTTVLKRDEYKKLRNIIIQLDTTSKSLWAKEIDPLGNRLKKKTIKNYLDLPSRISRISGKELEDKVLSKSRYPYLKINKHIYLPPIGKGKDSEYVYTLLTDCNLKDSVSKISYRVEMYRYLGDKKKELHGFGFRFERHNSGLKHNYWHVQVTNGLRGVVLPKCPSWIPQNVPCIPTIAENSLSLLCCILLSIYGKESFARLYPTLKISRRQIRSLEKHVNLIN